MAGWDLLVAAFVGATHPVGVRHLGVVPAPLEAAVPAVVVDIAATAPAAVPVFTFFDWIPGDACVVLPLLLTALLPARLTPELSWQLALLDV